MSTESSFSSVGRSLCDVVLKLIHNRRCNVQILSQIRAYFVRLYKKKKKHVWRGSLKQILLEYPRIQKLQHNENNPARALRWKPYPRVASLSGIITNQLHVHFAPHDYECKSSYVTSQPVTSRVTYHLRSRSLLFFPQQTDCAF